MQRRSWERRSPASFWGIWPTGAYRSAELEDTLAELGILLLTERSRRRPRRPPENRDHPCEHQARVRARGGAPAITLVGLATQVTAKMTAYTYDAFLVN